MGFKIDGDIKLLIASTYAMGVIALGNKGPRDILNPRLLQVRICDWTDCIGLPSNLLEIVNIIFDLIF